MSYLTIELTLAPGSAQAGGAVIRDDGSLALSRDAPLNAVPGETIQGFLVVNTPPNEELTLNSKGIDFHFVGIVRTERIYHTGTGKHRRSHHDIDGGDLFRMAAQTLVPNGETKYARNTVTKYPFAFTIPQEMPPSFGLAHNDHSGRWTASVMYEISATAYTAGIFTKNLKTQLIVNMAAVLHPYPNPQALQQASHSAEHRVPDYCGCECFGYQTFNTQATIAKTAVANGEVLPVIMEFHNQCKQDAIQRVTLGFQKAITMRCRHRETSQIQVLSQVDVAVRVPPTSSQSIQHALPVQGLQATWAGGQWLSARSEFFAQTHMTEYQSTTRLFKNVIPLVPYALLPGAVVGQPVSPMQQQYQQQQPQQGAPMMMPSPQQVQMAPMYPPPPYSAQLPPGGPGATPGLVQYAAPMQQTMEASAPPMMQPQPQSQQQWQQPQAYPQQPAYAQPQMQVQPPVVQQQLGDAPPQKTVETF